MDPETAVTQLIHDFVQGRLLLAHQEFSEGLTVAEYLALSDEQEAALWDRWYTEADRQVECIIAEASPDARRMWACGPQSASSIRVLYDVV